jgi:hypothetical protein
VVNILYNCSYRSFQDFNTLKEEFHEKFLNDESEFNGFHHRQVDSGNNEEILHLKVELRMYNYCFFHLLDLTVDVWP